MLLKARILLFLKTFKEAKVDFDALFVLFLSVTVVVAC